MLEPAVTIYTLDNGIRVVHQYSSSPVLYCGMMIHTGSRDELIHEQGLAHFIEHTVFKGTKKRKWNHILARMEEVGGESNAYTTKEETCFYTVSLTEYLERAVDLLADITFNSVFPDNELDKEKGVILDEINAYKDNPAEDIIDKFEEQLYEQHSLGYDILGSPKHVKSFNSTKVQEFIQRTYNTDEMVLSIVGNVSPDKVIKLAKKYLGIYPTNLRTFQRDAYTDKKVIKKDKKQKTNQVHYVFGGHAYSCVDDKRLPLLLLNNMLGGPAMNSRLNVAIREKKGYTYNIESNYTMYTDTGIWSCYFSTDKDKLDKCLTIIDKELSVFKKQLLSSTQLHKAKKQMIGQIAISQEYGMGNMTAAAKSILLFDKIDTMQQIYKDIEAIQPMEIIEVAKELFMDRDNFSHLLYY